jgi:hypothetical protein
VEKARERVDNSHGSVRSNLGNRTATAESRCQAPGDCQKTPEALVVEMEASVALQGLEYSTISALNRARTGTGPIDIDHVKSIEPIILSKGGSHEMMEVWISPRHGVPNDADPCCFGERVPRSTPDFSEHRCQITLLPRGRHNQRRLLRTKVFITIVDDCVHLPLRGACPIRGSVKLEDGHDELW